MFFLLLIQRLQLSCAIAIIGICSSLAVAQSFEPLSGLEYPFVGNGPGGYQGASFVDYDGDGDLDVFIGVVGLFRNDGGVFVKLTNSGIGGSVRHSWADYDNDGDLDLFTVGAFGFLYHNNGDDTFSKKYAGALIDSVLHRAWSCAWADINNDGFVDIATNHPAGFIPPTNNPTINHLLLNDGAPAFSFTELDSNLISNGFQPYTVGSWSDYDQDGDIDYFIGSGPANGTVAPDFLYKNLFVESGMIDFERITTSPIATDNQDGQLWNWIDFDNDGDLDAYLTNWAGATNRFYRNDGGTFTRFSGIPMVTDPGASLASIWGDFDNDGDLDCYVGNDNSVADRYYRNNGDGTFTDIDTLAFQGSSTRRSGAAGDFDNDGDLDLLLSGPTANMQLFRNNVGNSNGWISVKCVGTRSNRAAIGTKVRAKATINGNAVWQLREISSQNSFNSQNDLRVHFGFGDAAQIDSLRIEWPSGIVQEVGMLSVKQFMEITEDSTLTGLPGENGGVAQRFVLEQNYPNPFNPETAIRYQLTVNSDVQLAIYDLLGQQVKTLVSESQPAGSYEIQWNGTGQSGKNVASGVYLYRLETAGFSATRKLVLMR